MESVNLKLARRLNDERREQGLATLLSLAVVATVVAFPAALAGAAAAHAVWIRTQTRAAGRWGLAILGIATVYAMVDSGTIAPLWLPSNGALPLSPGWPGATSFLAGALAGPFVLVAAQQSLVWRSGRVLGYLARHEERDRHIVHWHRSALDPRIVAMQSEGHPPGLIRLGYGVGSNQPFDLQPRELAQHIFLPGASGSGKTTTLKRLADGALSLGWAVVIVDCKGGGLSIAARKLAEMWSVPFRVVDPDDSDSLGYNPCTGDPSEVTNKLLGAFTYEGAAEVYKLAAGQALPPIVRAFRALDRPLDIDALADSLNPGAMARLGRDAGEPHQSVLGTIESSRKDPVGTQAFTGLQFRLGMLREGKFGDVFRTPPYLDWDEVLDAPSVTYLSLPATAASEDVELLGRVIAQDLKQACARRFQSLKQGTTLPTVLVAFDEFAALREAEQLVDLLRQAREAEVRVVVSTQHLPESVPIRKSCLAAGLIIAHRLESEDADAIAGQYGTTKRWEATHQVDRETGYSQKGSVKRVDEYNVHPNALREMAVGKSAIRSVLSDRRAIVQVLQV